MDTKPIIVCNQCDMIQQESEIQDGGKALCGRCGTVLYRSEARGLEHSLVFALTAAILFLIANSFPIVTISSDGLTNSTTLIGAADRLIRDGIPSIALLVFTTTFVMPALLIGSLIYLLLPLSFGKLPYGLAMVFRLSHLVRPWAMIEVFMLGLLVTVTKLNAFASVAPDIGLIAFALLMIAVTAAAARYDVHQFWKRVELIKLVRVAA